MDEGRSPYSPSPSRCQSHVLRRRFLQAEAAGDDPAIAILLEPHALRVDLGRGQVLMPQGVLDVGEAARLVTDQAGEGMAGLVHVDMVEPGLTRVVLQVAREAVCREC